MDLGRFSVSLAVKDLGKSKAFYACLGFEVVPGQDFMSETQSHGYDDTWVILSNGKEVIGLFQGMFDRNTLTWNPTDVRAVQKELKKAGLELVQEADESTTGPAAAFLLDPDGNPVLLDQHDS